MSKYKIFLAITFLFITAQAALGQSIKWSQPLSNDRKLPYLKILGAVENGYYLLRSNHSFAEEKSHSKSRKYELQFFNNDLTMRWSQQLIPPCEDCLIADVELAGSRIIMLVSEFIKKQKLLKSHVQLLDASGKALGQP